MPQHATTGRSGVRGGGAAIGVRTGVPLAVISVLVLVSAVLIRPAAAVETPIAVSSTALDFGEVAAGSTATIAVQVTNTSTSPFGPINIFGGAPPTDEFNASQNCQAQTLAGGASCQITYTFSPTAEGMYSDSSNFTISPTANQADGEDFSIALTGRNGPPPPTSAPPTSAPPTSAPPTITSFSPRMGRVGASVVIRGKGFSGTSSVEFNGALASFTVNSDTRITAKVPAGAKTGPIKVTARGAMTTTSTTNFTVVAIHSRTITLKLRRHLVAKSRLAASDGFTRCLSDATVKVQRRAKGRWRTADSDLTNKAGRSRELLPDRPGKYRAKVKARTVSNGAHVCAPATSAVVKHRHRSRA